MPQNTTKFFGLSVAVRSELDLPTLEYMKTLLDQQLKTQNTTIPPDARVYIKHLVVSFTEKHFKVSGIENRLSYLGVDVSITKLARESGKITLIDLGCKVDPSIDVKRHSSYLNYKLPAPYISKNGQYCDYVAIIVRSGCKEKHKQLQVRATAHATPQYAQRLKNVPNGNAVTGMTFNLTQEVQLTLFNN